MVCGDGFRTARGIRCDGCMGPGTTAAGFLRGGSRLALSFGCFGDGELGLIVLHGLVHLSRWLWWDGCDVG
jgi:hypothetical protein